MRRHGLRIATIALLGLSSLFGCGIGDTMITGLGNGGNRIYADPVLDEVVDVLAESASVPRVSDEMLQSGFDAIQRRASEGDAQSVLILYRVAERQRANAVEE